MFADLGFGVGVDSGRFNRVGRKDIIKTILFTQKKSALSCQWALISLLHCIWKVLLKCHSGSATQGLVEKKERIAKNRQLKDKSKFVFKEQYFIRSVSYCLL